MHNSRLRAHTLILFIATALLLAMPTATHGLLFVPSDRSQGKLKAVVPEGKEPALKEKAAPGVSNKAEAAASAKVQVSSLGRPLHFEPNQGQTDPRSLVLPRR